MTLTRWALVLSGILLAALAFFLWQYPRQRGPVGAPRICESGGSWCGPTTAELRFDDCQTNPPIWNMDIEHFDVIGASFTPEGGVPVAATLWEMAKCVDSLEGGCVEVSIPVPPAYVDTERMGLVVTLRYKEKNYEYTVTLVEDLRHGSKWRKDNGSVRQLP